MKICYVCDDYPPYPQGGIYPPESGLPAFARDGDVGVWRVFEPRRPGGWIAARHRLYRLVAEWAKDGAIDIVEVPDHRGWGAYWPGLAVPMVVRLHGSSSFIAHVLGRPVHRIDGLLERASLRRADAVCSVSRFAAATTQKIFGLRSFDARVLYNPVEIPEAVTPFGERPAHRVVFVGALARMKGVISLVDAWPRIAAACEGAELHLFGKDNTLPSGEAMSAHLMGRLPDALRASMRIHGHVTREQVFQELAGTRIAVFPSYVEAFAFTPMEAMACGCATVYSRRGSGPELIGDGETGVLIDPDDPQEIADTVIALMKDPVRAARIAEAGRRAVMHGFSLEATLVENIRFYGDCIAAFGGAHD